jgi:hydrogenase maturation protease
MSRTLVLACGNSQRGDDGAALQIINYLKKDWHDPKTEFHFQQQWTPELAERISQAQSVIFVDAAVGTPPGSIVCRELQPKPGTSLHATHHASPEYLLQLSQELYGKSPVQAYLVTVAGIEFDLEETLSDPVLSAIPRASERIKALLSEVMQGSV